MKEVEEQNLDASRITNEEVRMLFGRWVERGKDRRGDRTYPCSDRVNRRRGDRRGK